MVVMAPFDPAVGAALAGVGNDPGTPGYLDDALQCARQPRLTGCPAPGCDLRHRLAGPSTRHRATNADPIAAAEVEPQPDDARAILTVLATLTRRSDHTAATARADRRVGGGRATRTIGARPAHRPARPLRRRCHRSHPGHRHAAVRPGRRTDHRPPHRADRSAVHRAAAGGHAAGLEPDRAARNPQRHRPPAGGRRLLDGGRPLPVGDDRQSRRFHTLATERSALPLALRNDLAVPIRVRLRVDAPPAMSVTDIGEQELPRATFRCGYRSRSTSPSASPWTSRCARPGAPTR